MGFALGEKKRGKLGKCEGMRKCVLHWGQYGHVDSKIEWLMCHRGEGEGEESDWHSAVAQFSGRSERLAQISLLPLAGRERGC